jgi:lysophospholipase L1-like esterase/pimeloyl-ACP methyl ester carboxylesterase
MKRLALALLISVCVGPAAGQDVVCIGDSITAGAGLAADHAWPALLQERLGPDARVTNLGVGGATLLRGTDRPYTNSSLWLAERDIRPQVVILMLGTNDTVLSPARRCWEQVEHLDEDLADLLHDIDERFASPRVLLCSPPPMFPERSGLTAERAADLRQRAPRLQRLAAHYKRTAAARPGVDFVDLSRALNSGQVTDGVHPNPFGAAAIADHLAAVLRTALEPLPPIPPGLQHTTSEDRGFTRLDFNLPEGAACTVVRPHMAAAGRPWIWRARFFGHRPELDLALLERGFHLVYCDVANLYGAPLAMRRWEEAYGLFRGEFGLGEALVLEGLSRGGLPVLNFAIAHPERVAAIVLDNGVCDFRSWPGGRNGKRSGPDWARLLEAYDLNEAQAWEEPGPLAQLEVLAASGVSLHVLMGGADQVVPPAENGERLLARYRELGGPATAWRKPGLGHHPHGLDPVAPLARALLRDLGVDDYNPAAQPMASVEYRGRAAGWGGGTWSDQLESMVELARGNPDLELVFFGDSITQGLTGAHDRLTNPGGERPVDRFPNAVSLGLSGDRTEHLLYRARRGALATLEPKLIVVQVGINNINTAHHTGFETAAGLRALVDRLLEGEPQATLLLCGPFPCGATSEDPRRAAIDEVHTAARAAATHPRVRYRDLRPLFLTGDGRPNALMAGDALHIKRAGQVAWMNAIAPILSDVLGD